MTSTAWAKVFRFLLQLVQTDWFCSESSCIRYERFNLQHSQPRAGLITTGACCNDSIGLVKPGTGNTDAGGIAGARFDVQQAVPGRRTAPVTGDQIVT